MRAATLAAEAAALKRQSGVPHAPFSLAFLTDRRRIAHPEPILRALPPGTAAVYRDYDDPERPRIADRYAALCRSREVLFLVAGDARLARGCGAAGVHYPSRLLGEIVPADDLIVSAACHAASELGTAASRGAKIAFLSPVFATKSHHGTEHLGAVRFCAMAAEASLPVLALGGVNQENCRMLAGANVAGFGAIGAYLPPGC